MPSQTGARIRTVAAIAILLVALGLRLAHLRARSMENDEIAEATWSSMSFHSMMDAVRIDAVHPPADYVVQFVVSRLGPEWVRRLPGVLAGTATVGLVMLLASWWMSSHAGLAAGVLLAVSPIHVVYSQSIRPYSSALFYIVASLAALEWYGRTQRRGGAVAWFIFVFLAGATLYFAGMVAAATSIFRIFLDRRERFSRLWRHLPWIVVAWTILYAPWFPVIQHVAQSPSPGGREHLDWPWWQWRLQSLGSGNDHLWEPVILASWVFWGLTVAGVAISFRFRLLRVAAFMLVAGTAFEIALLQIHPHYPAVRYLMPSWLASFILCGAAIDILSRHWALRPLGMACLALFAAISCLRIEEDARLNRSDWRGVALYVHARVKPGDRVIATNNWALRNFGYYWDRLPPIPNVAYSRYSTDHVDLTGPVWIISGGCFPRDAIRPAGLMVRFPMTEQAEVRYLRPQHRLSAGQELCPE